MSMRSKKGFVTVLAILLTAFLVILSAGALFLFMAEGRINRSLFDGFASYAGAEAGMEYALLKIKNHREGFEDALSPETPEGRPFASSGARAISVGYSISAFSRSYQGTIGPGEIEIVALFFDKGDAFFSTADTPLPYKNPNPGSSDLEKTADFILTADSDFSWNVLASDPHGTTFWIVGTGGLSASVGTSVTANVTGGTIRHEGVEESVIESRQIGEFLLSYEDAYLVITNPGTQALNYRLDSSNGFSKPAFVVASSGKIGSVVSNLELRENRSRHFDALKYSLFDSGN